MKKLLAIALLSIMGLQTSPAHARHWGWGPGIGFGIGFGFGAPYWGGYYPYGYAPYGYAYPYAYPPYPAYPAAYPAYPAGYQGPVTLPEKEQDASQERGYQQNVHGSEKMAPQSMKIREK